MPMEPMVSTTHLTPIKMQQSWKRTTPQTSRVGITNFIKCANLRQKVMTSRNHVLRRILQLNPGRKRTFQLATALYKQFPLESRDNAIVYLPQMSLSCSRVLTQKEIEGKGSWRPRDKTDYRKQDFLSTIFPAGRSPTCLREQPRPQQKSVMFCPRLKSCSTL